MRRIGAATSILLVACILALWWSRTSGVRTAKHPQAVQERTLPPAPEPEKGTELSDRRLLVTVRDAASGAALPGSTVVARPWNGPRIDVVAGADGEVEIKPLDGTVLAQQRGYAPECERVGISTSQLILLLQPGVAVRGRVVRAGSGSGIEGAVVTVRPVDSYDTVVELTTDREGRFEVPGLPPDAPFLVVAQYRGIAPVARLLRGPEPAREIILEMAGGAAVEGRVIRPDGTMASGVMVKIRPRGGEPLLPDELPFWVGDYVAETRTDADGAFRAEGLRVPAAYEITAEDDRMSRGRGDDVELREDGLVAWREIRLSTRTTLHLRVVFPPGTPSPYAAAYVRQNGEDVCIQVGGGIGEEGHTWELQTSGPHEVGVHARNWPMTRVPVDVREGAANEVVVRMTLEGHRVVSGRIVDETGIPLGGNDIVVALAGAEWTHPELDGSFCLCDVPAAPGTLTVRDYAGIYAPWSRSDVAPSADVEAVLRPAARFVGRVDPVPPSRRISVRRRNRAHWPPDTEDDEIGSWLVSTDAKGGFEIAWAPGKRIALAFDPPDAAPVFREEPPLAEGEVRDLGVIRLEPGRTADGVVLDDAENPVADCRVTVEMQLRDKSGWIILSGSGIERRIAYTGADGRFRVTRLPDAPLEVTLRADGLIGRTVDVPGPVGLHGMEIRLVRAGSVEGVLLDAGQRPVAGESVECASMQGDASFYGDTDSLGRFRILAAPGKYRLKSGDHEGPAVEVRARETTRVEFRVER